MTLLTLNLKFITPGAHKYSREIFAKYDYDYRVTEPNEERGDSDKFEA